LNNYSHIGVAKFEKKGKKSTELRKTKGKAQMEKMRFFFGWSRNFTTSMIMTKKEG